MFTSGQLLGSDYLIRLLGLDVDQIGLRLGDAAYEAYLIRQQLINALGTNLINGQSNEEAVIAHLQKYAAPSLADDIRANPKIVRDTYDWSLNDASIR